MAGPAAGSTVSDHLPGRAGGEDAGQDGRVENRAGYTAIGINLEGQKSVLGLWANGNEGAKYWMAVLTSLKNRGLKDAFVICTDGLKGHRSRVSEYSGADLHRAPDSRKLELCKLERTQDHRGGFAGSSNS